MVLYKDRYVYQYVTYNVSYCYISFCMHFDKALYMSSLSLMAFPLDMHIDSISGFLMHNFIRDK